MDVYMCTRTDWQRIGPVKLAGKDSLGVALAHYLPEHRKPIRCGSPGYNGATMAGLFGTDNAIYRITNCPPDLCALGQCRGYGGFC